jgi:oligopeptide transport system permease protein
MEQLKTEDFKTIGPSIKDSEIISRPNISYWKDAWRRLKQNKIAVASLVILAIIIIMSVIGPYFAKYGFNDQNYKELNKAPSLKHIFGTDSLGRDLYKRLWLGGRVSLIIGFAGTAVELLIGCIFGGISGYFGGKVDIVMMRVAEILDSIPYLIVVILMLTVLPPGIPTIILAMCITGWVPIGRLIRGQVLQLKESEYILAASALGAKPARIIGKHLIPNTIGIIIVYMSMDVPAFIFAEAFLSFLGLGVRPPKTSWGVLIYEGQASMSLYPWQIIVPGITICLTFMAFNLFGDGLRDALDPKLRQ